MNVICSRWEVADDVISGEDVETFGNMSLCKFVGSTIFAQIEISYLLTRRRLVHLSSILGVEEQNCLTAHAMGNEAL